jgi:hypothetical protein
LPLFAAISFRHAGSACPRAGSNNYRETDTMNKKFTHAILAAAAALACGSAAASDVAGVFG